MRIWLPRHILTNQGKCFKRHLERQFFWGFPSCLFSVMTEASDFIDDRQAESRNVCGRQILLSEIKMIRVCTLSVRFQVVHTDWHYVMKSQVQLQVKFTSTTFSMFRLIFHCFRVLWLPSNKYSFFTDWMLHFYVYSKRLINKFFFRRLCSYFIHCIMHVEIKIW